jgi:hypothetical protein
MLCERGGSKSEAIHIPAKVNDRPTNTGTGVHLDDETYLHFTDKIKYLGSIITWDLRDEIDVATRIAMGHSTITRMQELFTSEMYQPGSKL